MSHDCEWKVRTRRLVQGMKKIIDVGCADHLDCWDEADLYWYSPLNEASEALEGVEEGKK